MWFCFPKLMLHLLKYLFASKVFFPLQTKQGKVFSDYLKYALSGVKKVKINSSQRTTVNFENLKRMNSKISEAPI